MVELRKALPALDGLPATPGVPKPDPILVVEGLVKRFGGLAAVDVDHLEIQRGSITALIGPNGAGKSTLFNVLTGFEQADGGHAIFDGRSLDGVPAHRIARMGMVRTFQLTKALSKMTVIDNMKLAAKDQVGERFFGALWRGAWSAQEREIEARADALLEQFNLTRVRDDYAGTLSGGQRKLLEMARALMAEPTLVVLDEPTAGVNPALVQSLLEHVKALPERGMTVLFVEHDMDVVMGISDWVACMAQGQLVAEGRPLEVASNPVVVDAYLGTRAARR